MEFVAQQVERQIVDLKVAGSKPVKLPQRWSVDYRLPPLRLGIAQTSSALLSLLGRLI